MDITTIQSSAGQQDVVAFRLGRQTYALPIEPVVQIIEMVAITPIPQLSATVEGVINVHGEAAAVVKLRRHLGLPDTSLQLNTPIILVNVGEQTVGLIVDEVVDVLNLPDDQIVRLSDLLPETLGDAPVLEGLTYISENAMLMLSPDELFDPQELQILIQAVEMLETEPPTKADSPHEPAEPDKEVESRSVGRKRKTTPPEKAETGKPAAKAKPRSTRKQRKSTSTKEEPQEGKA